MENNGFKRAGSLIEEPIKTNNQFLKPAGDLEGNELNSESTVVMSASSLEEKLFGRVLDKTQAGYEDAIERKNAVWKEYTEIDNKISNGTATEADWAKHDKLVETYKREARAVETIKTYLENNANMVNKGIASPEFKFSKAGDLTSEVKPGGVGFEAAGDLNTSKQNNSFSFSEKKEETLKTPEEIRNWLKTIVSGEKKSNYAFGEGLLATGGGSMFVSIEKLQEMVKNGDNIIKAEYFENMNMVMIEFESFGIPSKSR